MNFDNDGVVPILAVSAEYDVDGQSYVCTKINNSTGSTYSMNGKSKPVDAGTTVTIYYDPDNPSDSVMHRSAFKIAVLFGTLTAGFIWLEIHEMMKIFFN